MAALVMAAWCVIQGRRNRDLRRALKTRLQASFNQFSQIAGNAKMIRDTNIATQNLEEKVSLSSIRASFILGNANAARSEIVAYARDHLKFVPSAEDPDNPTNGRERAARKGNNANKAAEPGGRNLLSPEEKRKFTL